MPLLAVSIFFHFCLLLSDRQTDVQNIYRIDAQIGEECAQKKVSRLS